MIGATSSIILLIKTLIFFSGVFMLLLINNREIMGEHVNGKVWNAVSWSTVVGLIVLTIAMLVTIF